MAKAKVKTKDPQPMLPIDQKSQWRHRNYKYPWGQHARYLRDHPNQWVMLEHKVSAGMGQYLRSGKQPDMAKLKPHVEFRQRNPVEEDNNVSTTVYYQLWARYTPEREAPPAKNRTRITDAQIQEIRERWLYSHDTVTDLSREYGYPRTSIIGWITGRTRKEAGGPITRHTSKAFSTSTRPQKNNSAEPDNLPGYDD